MSNYCTHEAERIIPPGFGTQKEKDGFLAQKLAYDSVYTWLTTNAPMFWYPATDDPDFAKKYPPGKPSTIVRRNVGD